MLTCCIHLQAASNRTSKARAVSAPTTPAALYAQLPERTPRRLGANVNPFHMAQLTEGIPTTDKHVGHVETPASRPTATKNPLAAVDFIEEASYCPSRSRRRVRSRRARRPFVPLHVYAAHANNRATGGVIVGSPPNHRYDLLKLAMKYDKEWC